MRKFTFFVFLIISCMGNSRVPRARILYGEYGFKEMRAKDSSHVEGSIRDLEVKKSEDLGIEEACYDGATDEVCELLSVGVLELNKKENKKFKIKCVTNDFGEVEVRIKSESEKINLPKIYQCK